MQYQSIEQMKALIGDEDVLQKLGEWHVEAQQKATLKEKTIHLFYFTDRKLV